MECIKNGQNVSEPEPVVHEFVVCEKELVTARDEDPLEDTLHELFVKICVI